MKRKTTFILHFFFLTALGLLPNFVHADATINQSQTTVFQVQASSYGSNSLAVYPPGQTPNFGSGGPGANCAYTGSGTLTSNSGFFGDPTYYDGSTCTFADEGVWNVVEYYYDGAFHQVGSYHEFTVSAGGGGGSEGDIATTSTATSTQDQIQMNMWLAYFAFFSTLVFTVWLLRSKSN